jgi:hypothetical protein
MTQAQIARVGRGQGDSSGPDAQNGRLVGALARRRAEAPAPSASESVSQSATERGRQAGACPHIGVAHGLTDWRQYRVTAMAVTQIIRARDSAAFITVRAFVPQRRR